MFKRLSRLFRGGAVPAAPPLPVDGTAVESATLATECDRAALSPIEWAKRRRMSASQYSALTHPSPHPIAAADPVRAAQTRAAAERVLRHEFNLLGSGWYVPVDPARTIRDGYAPIDWCWDPVRKLRFPGGIPHKQWNLAEMRPGNADVKYPWELGRCQHWVTLAQAFVLTGDRRYAAEIAHELDDFVEANPTGIGVNWTCTMDVGLRAVSWTIALDLIRQAPLDDAVWARAYSALFDHAVFIRNNLENTYEVTSNHFLSNLLGLHFAAAAFADLPKGSEWNKFARESIEHELAVQVLPDGADYESSIPYHRLVAELFLGAVRLADCQGTPFSTTTRARVRQMIAFLAVVTRPDGLMPQVGDADDGRLHVFEGYASTSPQDPRHILGPAALMFDEPGWIALGGGAARWEAMWWGFVVPDDVSSVDIPPSACLFPQAGIVVGRTAARDYLLITNGIVGTNGFGNHKHNDQLSFEYHRRGVALIVDPGSYVYTSDGAARNLFRSTMSHNTIAIDGVEQNDMRADWLFRMFETAKAETVAFDDGDGAVEYRGRHHGYERLDQPVTHERMFRLAKATGDLEIVDTLTGRGHHVIRWHFHFAPDVAVRRADTGEWILDTAAGQRCVLRVPDELQFAVRSAHYSPSYGVRIPCPAADASLEVTLAGERSWRFVLSS